MLFSKQNMAVLLMVMSSALISVSAKPTIDYCETCHSISDFIKEMELNQTESVLKTNFYKICLKENDQSNTRVCLFLANAVHNTFKHIGENDFCDKIDACSTGKQSIKKVNGNEEKCEFCVDLLESLKSLMSENTMDTLKESAKSYCQMTGDFQQECETTIDKNLVNFVNFFQNKMQSNSVCHAIRSCQESTIENLAKPTIGDLISLRHPDEMAKHLDSIEKNEKMITIIDDSTKPQSVVTCLACKQLMNIIYKRLSENATRENVIEMLSKSCKAIYIHNHQKLDECEKKIAKNADTIIQFFTHNVSPDLVCFMTGMCLPGEEVASYDLNLDSKDLIYETQSTTLERKELPLSHSLKCDFCEAVVDFAFKEMDTQKTRANIKQVLEISCSNMFRSESQKKKLEKCVEYVKNYTDKLIDLIEKAENANEVCKSLHMCEIEKPFRQDQHITTSKPLVVRPVKKIEKLSWLDDQKCYFCEKVIEFAFKSLDSQKTRHYIEHLLEKSCSAIFKRESHEKVRSKCVQYVQNYTDKLIDLIEKADNPGLICNAMHMCPVNIALVHAFDKIKLSQPLKSENKLPVEMKKALKMGMCEICTSVYPVMNNLAQIEVLNEQIQTFANNICQQQILPINVDDCKKNAKNYIDIVTHVKDSKQGCRKLDLCPPAKENSDSSKLLIAPKSNGKFECDACKITVKDAYDFLNQEIHSKQSDDLIKRACELIHRDDLKEKCKTEARKAIETLLKDLQDEFPPQEACEMMSLCPKKGLLNRTSKKLFYDKMICNSCKASFPILHEFFQHEAIKNMTCQTLYMICNGDSKCKNSIDEFVEDIADQEDALNGCKSVCVDKPQINLMRNQIFETFTKTDLLKDAIGLLPSENELLDESLLDNVQKPHKTPFCESCKKFMSQIHETIKDNENYKSKILDILLKTCPKDDDKCRAFYKNNINALYENLLQYTEPQVACKAMNFCVADFRTHVMPQTKESTNFSNTTLCKECESAVEYLIHETSDKRVIDFVTKEVEDLVCKKMDFVERKACIKMAKVMAPKIAKMIRDRLNTETICSRDLKLCPKDSAFEMSSNENDEMQFDLVNFVENPTCVICQRSVEKLNDKRKSNSYKLSIEEICGDDDAECSQFMLDFLSFFQNNDLSTQPMLACNKLDICLKPGHARTLGSGNKCLYGPSYWCLSTAHSNACKATKFCQQKFWTAVAN